jgi:hypothetical protein
MYLGCFQQGARRKYASLIFPLIQRNLDLDHHASRFGSKADIGARPINVRFTPNSGHWLSASGCLLCAISGREQSQHIDYE